MSALSFNHLDSSRLVASNEASRLHQRADINGAYGAARQQRSEQKVVARRYDDLKIAHYDNVQITPYIAHSLPHCSGRYQCL